MNDQIEISFNLLWRIKTGTQATSVEFSYAPYGMKINVGWNDNCHATYGLGTQQMKTADYEVVEFIIDYFNNVHETLKIT